MHIAVRFVGGGTDHGAGLASVRQGVSCSVCTGCLGCCATPGCGVSTASPAPSRISGRVTYEGKPVTEGPSSSCPRIAQGVLGSGKHQKDGTFVIDLDRQTAILERGRYDIVLRPPEDLSAGTQQSRDSGTGIRSPRQEKQAETKPSARSPSDSSTSNTSGLVGQPRKGLELGRDQVDSRERLSHSSSDQAGEAASPVCR